MPWLSRHFIAAACNEIGPRPSMNALRHFALRFRTRARRTRHTHSDTHILRFVRVRSLLRGVPYSFGVALGTNFSAAAEESRLAKPANAMAESFELTDKHCEILEPLTSKVRVLTHAQIARTFFPRTRNKDTRLRSVLAKLEEADYLKSYTAMVHPEIELEGPLCSYRPGDPDPDFALVARNTRGRWKRAPVTTDIVYASNRAKHDFGGFLGGRKPRPSESRHDIHVAQIYLNFANRDRALAAAWIPEEQLRQERDGSSGPLPDAEIRIAAPVIIEFGGAYPRAKLEAFHAEQKTQSYEIW